MYGGSEWDYQNDQALAEEEFDRCFACNEPAEEYLGGRVWCPDHADKAGRNGYR